MNHQPAKNTPPARKKDAEPEVVNESSLSSHIALEAVGLGPFALLLDVAEGVQKPLKPGVESAALDPAAQIDPLLQNRPR